MIAEPRNNLALGLPNTAAEKERKLKSMLKSMNNVVIAYSGGVDSTYLAHIATQEIGADAVCILGISPSLSAHQRNEALDTAEKLGLKLHTIETKEIEESAYRANAKNRCYFCKSELFAKLWNYAEKNNILYILDGTNADDLADHRPGRRAAEDKSVISPLADLDFSKKEIREMSKLHQLPSWDKPSSPCLSSRIAYGIPVNIDRLGKIEKAEEILRALGCREFRVRMHSEIARIELCEDDMPKLYNREAARRVTSELRKLGFKYITFDLEGFRSGALNE